MKKIYLFLILLLAVTSLVACKDESEDEGTRDDIYLLLMNAEDLSGMQSLVAPYILVDETNLNLPTEYQGVTITYASRLPEVISDDGEITHPNECWIESRDQQGVEIFEGLNDNWPVVIDVTLTYEGQTRTAKLLFVVAPSEGYTCNKYLG